MAILFKKCTNSDLDALIDISRKTFVDAFEKDNDLDEFTSYINEACEKKNIQQQLQNPDSTFYYVYKDDVLAGYFKLNTNSAQTDIKTGESIELERIYVLQEFQGNQIGKQMLQEALKLAARMQKKFIWLGVWEKNTDAIRFYQKHDFVKFGTHPYFIGKDEQTDWLLRFDLINFQKH
jgi:ribosomal protein S18 acetylase RimI-like enzyme